MIKDQPGDSYYVRAMFDRLPETNDSSQLTFQKDDILYIDNTMYNGVPGHWSAWLVDNEGQRTRWGIIPSKYKVSEPNRSGVMPVVQIFPYFCGVRTYI